MIHVCCLTPSLWHCVGASRLMKRHTELKRQEVRRGPSPGAAAVRESFVEKELAWVFKAQYSSGE